MDLGHHHGHITRMIAGSGIMLFVGGIMFFIHYDQPQVIKRKENSGAHSYDKAKLAGEYTIPYLYAFVVRKLGVIHTHLRAKHFF